MALDPFKLVIRDFYWRLISEFLCDYPEELEDTVELREILDDEDGLGTLTDDLVTFFGDLGFCLPTNSPDEKRAWISVHGEPSAGVTPAERAVRQLHWDLVINGEGVTTSRSETVVAWFAGMGMGPTVHTHNAIPYAVRPTF